MHRLWYKFLSWLISNTFSHSFSVIWLLMLSAVCSSSRSSLPPNYNKGKHSFVTEHQDLFASLLWVKRIRLLSFSFRLVCVCASLTRGLVGATLQARKASLYESSLTPRAFSPLKPSDSKPWGPPATRVLVSVRTPGEKTAMRCQKKKLTNMMCSCTLRLGSKV